MTGLLVLGASVAARRLADEAEALARARDLLVTGEARAASALFAAHVDSPWRGAEARAGLALTRALAPEHGHTADIADSVALSEARAPLRAALDLALASGDAEALLRVVDLPGSGAESLLPLYRAAALVSLGRHDEAVALRAEAPALFAGRALGERIAEAIDARGAAIVVRDRRGRLVGTWAADGEFQATSNETSAWLRGPGAEAISGIGDSPGLRVSLDLDVAAIARDALGRHRGTVVVVDVASGEVLAAVSDARSRRRMVPAFEQRREPASIMKVLTTAAALRAGRDPDAEIARMNCQLAERYAGKVLWCSYRAGPLLSLDRAMAMSCNIAFANLGVSLGRQAILDELRHWGFDREDLPAAGRIKVAAGDDRQLADLSIGLEATDITPIHAALLAATVAGDGVMPQPALLSARDGVLGMSPRALPRAPGTRVVDAPLVPVLRRSMEAVTDYGGTASGVAPQGYGVAMKTGTASEWRRGYHVNYIGFGPLPDPEIAFCVRVTHKPSSLRVRNAAKLVTRSLLEGLADLHARRFVRPKPAPSVR